MRVSSSFPLWVGILVAHFAETGKHSFQFTLLGLLILGLKEYAKGKRDSCPSHCRLVNIPTVILQQQMSMKMQDTQ